MSINKEFQLVLELLKEFGIFSFANNTQAKFYKNFSKNLVNSVNKGEKVNSNNIILPLTKNEESQIAKTHNLTPKNITTGNCYNNLNINRTTYENINLDYVKSLDELKEILMNYKECSLSKMATNTVFGVGNFNADLLMIGEAPGEAEDLKGEPFVGRSGQLLTKALTTINVFRENIFTTNTVFWRPPGNRNPTSYEVDLCRPFIQKIISLIKPKMILIVGRVAATSLLKEDIPISKLRGKWLIENWGYENEIVKNINVRVLYHPAYLLRNPKQKKVFWFDLIEISNKILDLKLNV